MSAVATTIPSPATRASRSVPLSAAEIDAANERLADAAADDIVAWALATATRPVVTTNFRPRSIAFIHLVTRQAPAIPVIWVDTGFNTTATYRFAAAVTERLGLNLKVFTPAVTAARWAAQFGPIPSPGSEHFETFSHAVKLAPFDAALEALRPDLWLTGVRRGQTDFRAGLEIVSRGARDTTRVAPIIDWTERDTEAYIDAHGLPDNDDYDDPTKPSEYRECGLQTLT